MSQDLIKKEEERRMMESLLSRDEGSQRRKSFKTYREIVEDKYTLFLHSLSVFMRVRRSTMCL